MPHNPILLTRAPTLNLDLGFRAWVEGCWLSYWSMFHGTYTTVLMFEDVRSDGKSTATGRSELELITLHSLKP